MKIWIVGLGIVATFIAGAFAFWHLWLEERYRLDHYHFNDTVPYYELVTHRSRYLNKPVVLRGYLHYNRYQNGGDILLYPSQTDAEIENMNVAIVLAYPFDGKIACDDQYVEVSGVFELLPVNEDQMILQATYGVGQIDYIGKIDDTVRVPGTGLIRPSCPSKLLPENFGVGIFRDAWGNKVADPYQYTSGD